MAKCPVCNTRKGKRKCAIVNNEFVCSLCCANTRKEELCLDCVFYQPPQYNYGKVPIFSDAVLENNHALKNYHDLIMKALNANSVHDLLAMVELLIIKYHFKETELKFQKPEWETGFNDTNVLIQSKLNDFDEEIVVNLLSTIRHHAFDIISTEAFALQLGISS